MKKLIYILLCCSIIAPASGKQPRASNAGGKIKSIEELKTDVQKADANKKPLQQVLTRAALIVAYKNKAVAPGTSAADANDAAAAAESAFEKLKTFISTKSTEAGKTNDSRATSARTQAGQNVTTAKAAAKAKQAAVALSPEQTQKSLVNLSDSLVSLNAVTKK